MGDRKRGMEWSLKKRGDMMIERSKRMRDVRRGQRIEKERET